MRPSTQATAGRSSRARPASRCGSTSPCDWPASGTSPGRCGADAHPGDPLVLLVDDFKGHRGRAVRPRRPARDRRFLSHCLVSKPCLPGEPEVAAHGETPGPHLNSLSLGVYGPRSDPSLCHGLGVFPVLFFLDGRPPAEECGPHRPRRSQDKKVLLRSGFVRFGVIKPTHLAPLAGRKAFIYVLEIIAQVLPFVTFARRLPPLGLHAIIAVPSTDAVSRVEGRRVSWMSWSSGAASVRAFHFGGISKP